MSYHFKSYSESRSGYNPPVSLQQQHQTETSNTIEIKDDSSNGFFVEHRNSMQSLDRLFNPESNDIPVVPLRQRNLPSSFFNPNTSTKSHSNDTDTNNNNTRPMVNSHPKSTIFHVRHKPNELHKRSQSGIVPMAGMSLSTISCGGSSSSNLMQSNDNLSLSNNNISSSTSSLHQVTSSTGNISASRANIVEPVPQPMASHHVVYREQQPTAIASSFHYKNYSTPAVMANHQFHVESSSEYQGQRMNTDHQVDRNFAFNQSSIGNTNCSSNINNQYNVHQVSQNHHQSHQVDGSCQSAQYTTNHKHNVNQNTCTHVVQQHHNSNTSHQYNNHLSNGSHHNGHQHHLHQHQHHHQHHQQQQHHQTHHHQPHEHQFVNHTNQQLHQQLPVHHQQQVNPHYSNQQQHQYQNLHASSSSFSSQHSNQSSGIHQRSLSQVTSQINSGMSNLGINGDTCASSNGHLNSMGSTMTPNGSMTMRANPMNGSYGQMNEVTSTSMEQRQGLHFGQHPSQLVQDTNRSASCVDQSSTFASQQNQNQHQHQHQHQPILFNQNQHSLLVSSGTYNHNNQMPFAPIMD